MSLSLFTAELERWALDFIFLISPILTGGFKFCDLQVIALATSILFSGLHFEFGHPEVLHEAVGVSMSQVAPFEGNRATWLHL